MAQLLVAGTKTIMCVNLSWLAPKRSVGGTEEKVKKRWVVPNGNGTKWDWYQMGMICWHFAVLSFSVCVDLLDFDGELGRSLYYPFDKLTKVQRK
ncbi:MAG: hypothetical protein ACF788_13210 [Novipirellula sp. JB048]